MPWEKAYNETEVLERAMRAFWARGYEATSIADLVAATGINRGSIYAAFTNKQTLFMAALRHYDQVHRAEFLDHVGRRHEQRDAIFAAFESAASQTGDEETPGGCLLVNTALELSPHDPDTRTFVDSSLEEVENFFFDRIEAAQRQGTIPGRRDARATAQALLGLFLGLRVLARSNPQSEAIKTISVEARRMVE